MTNNLSVVINSDAQQVWTMLREPALVAQWHGWTADDQAAEINEIYFSPNVVEAADHTSLKVDGGDIFTLHPVQTGTEVSITRSAVDHDSEWAAWDEDITQGWLTFLHQLRFALERHPHGKRKTLFCSVPGTGGSAIEKLGLDGLPAAGEPYSLTLATGEKISGKVWFRSNHQAGLTVHSYAEHGEGLVIVADQPAIPELRPDGGSLIIVSTYDLGAHQLESIRTHWDSWRAENYPTSEPMR
ncbi:MULTISPECIES: SRPBCC domain-containing protein [Arthrobacter]|uniref:SRPBCC domain-containing protein n=1 Tax=Arthrobacter oryzae TaxID=409290 RepID=A0A3N0BMK9_9MICC|nr:MULTISPECIES: SRPBCC domain-containing protein [Arthrobacter]QYF88588.1 SRPBCC domain-containing protein [Arthrobacter sp. PAMC25284]RNL49980.1 SRPBCC domain-containing protein [Arthrobacter oryzae]